MIRVHAAGPVRWIFQSASVRSDRIHAVSNHTGLARPDESGHYEQVG